MVRWPLSLGIKATPPSQSQLNHGVIRQFRNLHLRTPTCSQACFIAAPTSLPGVFSPCAIVSFAASKSASCARLRSQTVSYQA